jgi:hypothetical protein
MNVNFTHTHKILVFVGQDNKQIKFVVCENLHSTMSVNAQYKSRVFQFITVQVKSISVYYCTCTLYMLFDEIYD